MWLLYCMYRAGYICTQVLRKKPNLSALTPPSLYVYLTKQFTTPLPPYWNSILWGGQNFNQYSRQCCQIGWWWLHCSYTVAIHAVQQNALPYCYQTFGFNPPIPYHSTIGCGGWGVARQLLEGERTHSSCQNSLTSLYSKGEIQEAKVRGIAESHNLNKTQENCTHISFKKFVSTAKVKWNEFATNLTGEWEIERERKRKRKLRKSITVE